MTSAPELLPDPHPETVTVTGEGLLAWCARADVFIPKMALGKFNGEYVLTLVWLDGRTVYDATHRPPPQVQPPLRPKARQQATGDGAF